MILNTPPAEARGQGRAPPAGKGVPGEEVGTGGEGLRGRGRDWGGDSLWLPLPSHAPPLLRQKLPGQLLVLSVGAAGCWWQQRGPAGCLRSSAGRARRGVCCCWYAPPAPHLPMQPWQCLRRFALAWWERTAEGRARSPREEAGPRDAGGRGEPGELDQRSRQGGNPGLPFPAPLLKYYRARRSCSPQLWEKWDPRAGLKPFKRSFCLFGRRGER